MTGFQAQLGEQFVQVDFHGPFAYSDGFRDYAIGKPPGQEADQIAIPARKTDHHPDVLAAQAEAEETDLPPLVSVTWDFAHLSPASKH
jgi:hypothetical protein